MLSLLLRDSGLHLVMSVSVLLFGGVLDLSARISRAAEMVVFRVGPHQKVVPTPISRGFAPLFPSSPTRQ